MRYEIVPVPKPRMTRSDAWKKRPAVMRYWKFKDECCALSMVLEDCSHITFIMPMPASWSNKKRREMSGTPHRAKPDFDNLAKAICDALYEDDSFLHDMRITKVWGESGAIIIEPIK